MSLNSVFLALFANCTNDGLSVTDDGTRNQRVKVFLMTSETLSTATNGISGQFAGQLQDEAAFIAEHGRLYRAIEHAAFDPFRRKVIKVPQHIQVLMRLASLFLIPFRITLAVTAISISYILVILFGPRVTASDVADFNVSVIPPWRRTIVIFATKFLGRTLLVALGFWRVKGSDDDAYIHEEAANATIISNHSSLADPCLLAYLFAPAFVAKTHVYNIPGVGRVGAAQHAFYIDRMHGSRMSIAEKIAERQKIVVQANGALPPVAIFPEGTTTNGEHLLKFRTGAFIAGTPVVPVLIRYSCDWFSPSYESIKTGKYVLGLLSQFANYIFYHRLPVYYPSEAEKADPALYASNVHKFIRSKNQQVFGTPLVPSTSNLVDKMEYNTIIRGESLRKGLQLNVSDA